MTMLPRSELPHVLSTCSRRLVLMGRSAAKLRTAPAGACRRGSTRGFSPVWTRRWSDLHVGSSPSDKLFFSFNHGRRGTSSDALSLLEDEVSKLQRSPPAGVMYIGSPKAVPYKEVAGHLAPVAAHEGPWEVPIVVSGEGLRKDGAYNARYRVRLRFPSGWPLEVASIRFSGTIQHGYLREDGSLPPALYSRLGDPSVRTLLNATLALLSDDVTSVWGRLPSSEEQAQVEAKAELNRRRLDVINSYRKVALWQDLLAPDLTIRPDWLASEFRQACAQDSRKFSWHDLLEEHIPNEVYSFPLLSESFCDKLSEELSNFLRSGLPAQRPNTMNSYGAVLADMGLEGLVDGLQALLQPLGACLYPGMGSAWDGHHCFAVQYRPCVQSGLDMHVDDSDVTFNVCVGKSFQGARLRFCGEFGAPDHRRQSFIYQHHKGRCIVHRGRWRHGADDITEGERFNIILWNRSSEYRRTEAFRSPSFWREHGPPDPECLSFTHDRDFGVFKPYPSGKEHFAGKGWVPPEPVEYEGFVAEMSALSADHRPPHPPSREQ